MIIQRINVQPMEDPIRVKAPSKKAPSKGITSKITPNPSSLPPAETTLSDRDIRYAKKSFNGILAVGCTAASILGWLAANDLWNQKWDQCTKTPSTCDLLDSNFFLFSTSCAFAAVTACLGIENAGRWYFEQNPQ